jgi:hypothetical protein
MGRSPIPNFVSSDLVPSRIGERGKLVCSDSTRGYINYIGLAVCVYCTGGENNWLIRTNLGNWCKNYLPTYPTYIYWLFL